MLTARFGIWYIYPEIAPQLRDRLRNGVKKGEFMAGKRHYLTREGLTKLQKELGYLKNERRRELSKEIGAARAHGDISENAEYDAAKDAQALNEKRIAELEQTISTAELIDETKLPKDEVTIGTTVKLQDRDSKNEITYMLVGEAEADFSQGKISISSLVGKALMGCKKNQTVEIKVPAGILKYKILDISR